MAPPGRGRALEGPGGRGFSRYRERLFRHVGLVFSDGIPGDDRLNRVRRSGRAGKAVVVFYFHSGADGIHLSDHRCLDLGWRLAF